MKNIRNQVFSSFLVAGAAIGSGVLALPILAAGPGLINTLIFITLTFIVAYIVATNSIDIYARYDDHNVNAATIAVDFFGRKGYWFSTIVNMLSMGASVAAYINAGGDLLSKLVLPLINIHFSSQLSALLFFIVFMPAFIIGLGVISRLNSLIFIIKFTCLSLGIILGMKLINLNIFQMIPNGSKYLGAGASTMFCIWGMHMVLPLVLKLNNWNPNKAKQAVLLGMIIPAFGYIGWLFLIFSLVNRQDFLHLITIGDVIHFALTKSVVPTIIGSLIGVFASITVLTAFFSIGFSLVAFIIDALKWHNTVKSRFFATVIAFILPLILALSFPKAFVTIYQHSNIFLIIAALIPIAALYMYNKQNKLPKYLPIILILFGVVVVLSQILNDFSLLPVFT